MTGAWPEKRKQVAVLAGNEAIKPLPRPADRRSIPKRGKLFHYIDIFHQLVKQCKKVKSG